jgi:putative flippase GtrA
MTVLLRRLIGQLVGDTPERYLLSVVAAYAVGILVSFVLHKHYTFRERMGAVVHPMGRALIRFTAIALTGMVLTGALAVAVRYLLVLDALVPGTAAAVAFVVASLITSVVTYALNARLSF